MKITLSIETASVEEAQSILAKLNGAPNLLPQTVVHNHAGPTAEEYAAKLAAQNAANQHEETPSSENVDGQLDTTGLAWDKRIHSSSKKKTNAGVWTRRKGVEDAVFNQVSGELRGAAAQHQAPAQQPQYAAPQQQQYAPPQQQYAPPQQQHVEHHQAPQYSQPPQGYTPPPHPQHGASAPVVGGEAYAAPQQQYAPPVAQQQPAPQMVQQHQAPQAAPVNSGAPTITDVFAKISPMFASDAAGANTYVNSLVQRLSTQFQANLTTISDISNRPDMVSAAMNMLIQDGK